MSEFYHAHRVVEDLCCGHMACMRVCPTQAIRVRSGKAVISNELCVDCGECFSACPSGAIESLTDPVAELADFKYKVIVPAPVLYSQFDPSIHPYVIHQAFQEVGFDRVIDVSTSSAALAHVLEEYIQTYSGRLPLISSFCPSIVRLIQVKYPDLVELVVPLDVPREVTAREIKKTLPKELGLNEDDVGVFFIATCPAKIVSIRQPAEKARSWFDGALSVKDVYSILLPHVIALKEKFHEDMIPDEYVFNSGWAAAGSITRAAGTDNWLTVTGIDHVKKILDDIENSRLRNVEFVEMSAHMEGCMAGPFNVENPHVARANMIKQSQRYGTAIEVDVEDVDRKLKDGYYMTESPVLPRATTYFDTDLATSIKRMKECERVFKKLRQIDCGVCGAPTCMAFAEDLVRGEAEFTDCIFLGKKEEDK